MIIYKIRRKSDGLFSMGGSDPHWNKTGKIWKQRGHLTSHLRGVLEYAWKGTRPYGDAEIVTYELVETEVDAPITIRAYLQQITDKKNAKEEIRRLATEKRQQQSRYQEYLKLQQEFEK